MNTVGNKDQSFYLVIKHWEDGTITTQESEMLTRIHHVINDIKGGGEFESFEVIEVNPVEGYSRDITEDVSRETGLEYNGYTVAVDLSEPARVDPNAEHKADYLASVR